MDYFKVSAPVNLFCFDIEKYFLQLNSLDYPLLTCHLVTSCQRARTRVTPRRQSPRAGRAQVCHRRAPEGPGWGRCRRPSVRAGGRERRGRRVRRASSARHGCGRAAPRDSGPTSDGKEVIQTGYSKSESFASCERCKRIKSPAALSDHQVRHQHYTAAAAPMNCHPQSR